MHKAKNMNHAELLKVTQVQKKGQVYSMSETSCTVIQSLIVNLCKRLTPYTFTNFGNPVLKLVGNIVSFILNIV